MVRRITEDTLNKMIAMRKSGSTYAEIVGALGVSKERCIAYLKNVDYDGKTSVTTTEWTRAESEAGVVLQEFGFTSIWNLNTICSSNPTWDYAATRNNEMWLIDVTITNQKSVISKRDTMINGYNYGILLKDGDRWKLIKLLMTVTEDVIRHFEPAGVIS
jgi:hypothetical protein